MQVCSVNDLISLKQYVSVKLQVDNAKTSITYACWYGRIHSDPSGKLLKQGQSKSKVYQKLICSSQNSWNMLIIQETVK